MKRMKNLSGLTSIPRKNSAISLDVRLKIKMKKAIISWRSKLSLLQRRSRKILTLKMSSI
jgi:hypothetical protein